MNVKTNACHDTIVMETAHSMVKRKLDKDKPIHPSIHPNKEIQDIFMSVATPHLELKNWLEWNFF